MRGSCRGDPQQGGTRVQDTRVGSPGFPPCGSSPGVLARILLLLHPPALAEALGLRALVVGLHLGRSDIGSLCGSGAGAEGLGFPLALGPRQAA